MRQKGQFPIGILVSGEAGFSRPAMMATQRSERPLALFALAPGAGRLVPKLVNESLHRETGLRLGFSPSRSGLPETFLVFDKGEGKLEVHGACISEVLEKRNETIS